MVIVPAGYHLFKVRLIREQMRSIGIAAGDIYIVPFNVLSASAPAVPFDEYIFLESLDVHVTDNCNLNCAGCSHFSPCVRGEVHHPVEGICNALSRLAEIIPDIKGLWLLGGEPLLHPELDKIAAVTRNAYPHASIAVITNGILVPHMPPELIRTLKENNVSVSISLYPALRGKTDAWVAFLRRHGLVWSITAYERFERRFTSKPMFDKARQFAKCGHCAALRGSRLGWCVLALFADYYNAYFGEKLLPADKGVDIFDHASGASLMAALQKPLDLCARCVSRDTGGMFCEEWRTVSANGGPRLEDWLIKFPFEERR
jgi:hypothetical protein